ncbi:NAD(P)-binding protein [Mycena kentingensis (nom. inval.)]|nr:NAD(P)-binding protein [Mycena kentingensis (nom. inval.)]
MITCYHSAISPLLDFDLLRRIIATGHSRLPVFEDFEELNGSIVKKILGVLLVKQLVLLDPKDAVPLKAIPLNTLFFVPNNVPLLELLDKFQDGQSHMAVVSRFKIETDSSATPAKRGLTQQRVRVSVVDGDEERQVLGEPGVVESPVTLDPAVAPLGIITLEDVLEELIGEEIYDEFDALRAQTDTDASNPPAEQIPTAVEQPNVTAKATVVTKLKALKLLRRRRGAAKLDQARSEANLTTRTGSDDATILDVVVQRDTLPADTTDERVSKLNEGRGCPASIPASRATAQRPPAVPYSRPGTPGASALPNGLQIGFVGLGAIGGVMAKNLANYRASHVPGSRPILVWNRTANKGEALRAELGENKIRVTASLEQIATECDVVFTALANDEVVKEVYEQLAKTLKATPPTDHKIFVETSTIYPTLAGELDTLISSIPHCHLVASPVFGTPAVALGAQLVIAMSGDYRSKKEVAYMLARRPERSIILSSSCAAYTLKLIGNSMILGTLEILAESYTLAEKSGIAATEVHKLVKDIFPAPNIVRYSERMSTNDFNAKNGFSINGGIKDASHIRRLTAVHNAPMPSIDIAHQHLITARAIHTGKVQAGQDAVDVLDWSGIAAGARVAAGLPPFETTNVGVVTED